MGGGQHDESGRGDEEEAMRAAAMLPREGRWWGDRDDNDGKEEVKEVRWTTTTRPLRR